jgi:colicin import membrane protein
MRVTREDVDKARADYAVAIKVADAAEEAADAAEEAADAAEEAADAAEEAAWNKYIKLRNEYEMITKEDKARADDAAAKKARYAASNAVMGNTNNGRE